LPYRGNSQTGSECSHLLWEQEPVNTTINVQGAWHIDPNGNEIVLAGTPKAMNTVETPDNDDDPSSILAAFGLDPVSFRLEYQGKDGIRHGEGRPNRAKRIYER